MKETQATRQIHSLSDEEVSRWIAEKLEPIAPNEPKGDVEYLSPALCYRWTMRPHKDWTPYQAWHWQPRDFVNDAQMTLLLLEKLQAEFATLIIQKNYIRAEPSLGKYYEGRGELGRAIAEAFMLANGYKEC